VAKLGITWGIKVVKIQGQKGQPEMDPGPESYFPVGESFVYFFLL